MRAVRGKGDGCFAAPVVASCGGGLLQNTDPRVDRPVVAVPAVAVVPAVAAPPVVAVPAVPPPPPPSGQAASSAARAAVAHGGTRRRARGGGSGWGGIGDGLMVGCNSN